MCAKNGSSQGALDTLEATVQKKSALFGVVSSLGITLEAEGDEEAAEDLFGGDEGGEETDAEEGEEGGGDFGGGEPEGGEPEGGEPEGGEPEPEPEEQIQIDSNTRR